MADPSVVEVYLLKLDPKIAPFISSSEPGGGMPTRTSLAALVQSAEKLPVPVCITNEQFRSLRPNRRWQELFGSGVRPKTPWVGFRPESSREASKVARKARLKSSEFSLELQGKSKDSRWFRLDVTPIVGGSGQVIGWWWIARDIAHQKHSSAQTLAREKSLREMLDSVEEFCFVTSPDFRQVLDISHHNAEICGTSAEELCKSPGVWLSRIIPEDRRQLEIALVELQSGKSDRVRFECRMLRRSDAELRTISCLARGIRGPDLQLTRIIWLVSDISEHQAIEMALRRSEERFQLAAAASSEGIFDWDITKHHVYYSPRWKAMLGYREHELSPHFSEWRERLDPRDRNRALQYFASFLDGHGKEFLLEAWIQHKDGSSRWIIHHGTALRDAKGKPLRIIGTAVDQTQSMQLQRRILEATENERRMVGLDLHEGLGQELTGAEMLCQTVATRIPKSDATSLELLSTLLKLIQNTVNHVRTISRGLIPTSLAAYGLADALDDLARGISETHGVSCRLTRSGQIEKLDDLVAVQLFRITQEGINYAIKHSRATRIDLHLQNHRDKLVLVIEDNGLALKATPEINWGSHGLEIMQHRAKLVDAHIEFESGVVTGSRTVCTLEWRR